MSLSNKFPVSYSPHLCTHISHHQRTPRDTPSPALNPGISASVSLLVFTPLIQTIITAHLDPVSSPSSSPSGFPIICRTHIIENHLPQVSLRSHCSPPHMPVKAPSCLSNHNKTLHVSDFKAHHQLALLYLTAVLSCPAQFGCLAPAKQGPSTCAAILRCPKTTMCVHLQVCAYVCWAWGRSLPGREEETMGITTPFIFCSREILKHEHQR